MARYMPDNWPLPAIDPQNQDFFTTGRMLVQRCDACGTVQHPPEEVCYRCQGSKFTSVESKGTGTVYSYIVVHHPTSPLLAERVPYAVALVALDDFPEVRILGNVLNRGPEELSIGLPVRATWEDVVDDAGEHVLLPQWNAA